MDKSQTIHQKEDYQTTMNKSQTIHKGQYQKPKNLYCDSGGDYDCKLFVNNRFFNRIR